MLKNKLKYIIAGIVVLMFPLSVFLNGNIKSFASSQQTIPYDSGFDDQKCIDIVSYAKAKGASISSTDGTDTFICFKNGLAVHISPNDNFITINGDMVALKYQKCTDYETNEEFNFPLRTDMEKTDEGGYLIPIDVITDYMKEDLNKSDDGILVDVPDEVQPEQGADTSSNDFDSSNNDSRNSGTTSGNNSDSGNNNSTGGGNSGSHQGGGNSGSHQGGGNSGSHQGGGNSGSHQGGGNSGSHQGGGNSGSGNSGGGSTAPISNWTSKISTSGWTKGKYAYSCGKTMRMSISSNSVSIGFYDGFNEGVLRNTLSSIIPSGVDAVIANGSSGTYDGRSVSCYMDGGTGEHVIDIN